MSEQRQDMEMLDTPQAIVSLLGDLERRSRERAQGLPQQELIQSFWEGVMFYIGDNRFVAPLSAVKEILNFPSTLTQVPGTRPWMLGVANVRGTLIPVIDLQLFLIGRKTRRGRRSRVLVFEMGESYTSVLVGEMVGMRHFARETAREMKTMNNKFEKYVRLEFDQDGMTWPVFSLSALAEDPGFQIAAL
jgi:twitching motility protein PilI